LYRYASLNNIWILDTCFNAVSFAEFIFHNVSELLNLSELIEFLENKWGYRMAFYRNFKYNFGLKSKIDGSIYWRCVTWTCSALICLDQNDLFISITREPNHDSSIFKKYSSAD